MDCFCSLYSDFEFIFISWVRGTGEGVESVGGRGAVRRIKEREIICVFRGVRFSFD